MRKINGKDLLVFLQRGEAFHSIAVSTSCSLYVSVDTIEVLSANSFEWRNYIQGKKGWQVQTTAFMTDKVDPLDLLDREVRLMFGTAGDDHVAQTPGSREADGVIRRYGNAIITSITETGEKEGKATCAITFQGTGELLHDSSPVHSTTWYDYEDYNENEIWKE